MPPPNEQELPKPGRRLWRTIRRKPRDLSRIAPPIPFDSVVWPRPSDAEQSHWGQYGLLEDIVYVMHRDGTATYRRRWIMILHSVEQIERWERFEYSFDRRVTRITIERAAVILPNEEELDANVTDCANDMWGNSRVLKINFTRLAPGVVLEFEDQHDNFMPFEDHPGESEDQALQTAYPCRRRRITLAVARPFSARFNVHNGAPAPVEREEGEYHIWSWDVRNVPGIEWDEITPHLYEFAPWIDYSTLPNWNAAAKRCFTNLKAPIYHDVKDLALTLEPKGEGALCKLAAAYSYVTRDVRYGRPKVMSEDPAIRPPGIVAEELRGDCKDKSALLQALLQELGIEARIALVRTRKNGCAAFLPGVRFDHAIVVAQVDGEELWLDPVGTHSLGQLPYMDQGVQALILDRRNPRETTSPAVSSADHRHESSVRGRLDADGSCRGRFQLRLSGDLGATWRRRLPDRNAAVRERELRRHVGGCLPLAEITDLKVQHLDDLDDDLVIDFNATLSCVARRINDLVLLRVPWSMPFQDLGLFAAPSRSQPLRTPYFSVSDRLEIELPAGFSGYGLPWERVDECRYSSYRCLVRIYDDKLMCERDYALRGGVIPPEDYDMMRKSRHACVDSDSSEVVLWVGELAGRQ